MRMGNVLIMGLTGILISCSKPTDTAGGAGGTETTNGIAGVVLTEKGKVAANVEVILRSTNYTPAGMPTAKRSAAPNFTLTDTSDANGHFEFVVEDTGSFVIESFIRDTSALFLRLHKPNADPVSLWEHQASPTGSLSGTVNNLRESNAQTVVQVLGTESSLTLAPGETEFSFPNLPAGSHHIRVMGSDTVYDTASVKDIAVISNQDQQVAEIRIKWNLMLIDGISAYHDWQTISSQLMTLYRKTGIFNVVRFTTPPAGSTPQDWEPFNPPFASFDAVILNFDNQDEFTQLRWPPAVESAFENYMNSGGGLVIHHASFFAFQASWEAFNEMRGLGQKRVGRTVYIDSLNQVIITDSLGGEAYQVMNLDTITVSNLNSTHPISQGLPTEWIQTGDALQIWTRGPANNMTVLHYSVHPDLGWAQPVDWTVSYGAGRVYVNNLGHVNSPEGIPHHGVGLQTLLIRGAEWAATGNVTTPVPANFPTRTQASLNNIFDN